MLVLKVKITNSLLSPGKGLVDLKSLPDWNYEGPARGAENLRRLVLCLLDEAAGCWRGEGHLPVIFHVVVELARVPAGVAT